MDDTNERIWKVVRQDDAGNRFAVKENLTAKEADDLVSYYEAKAHKQIYWKEKMTPKTR